MTLNRDEIEFVLSDNRYLKGGTKEACVKVRQVLKNSQNNCNQLHESFSSVEIDEFLEAVKVLMASAFKKEDEIPETWYCDNDCKMVSNLLCPGECNLSNDSKKRCPFFIDEQYISYKNKMETMIIPRISDEELMKRYSKIRPIVSIDGVKYFLRDYTLEKIKCTSYIWYALEDKTEFADFDSSMKVIDFKCLHTYGHPLMFNPSIAEVLSQIPDENLEKIDAFEIIEEPQCLGELEFDESAYKKGYHVSIVRLYKRTFNI